MRIIGLSTDYVWVQVEIKQPCDEIVPQSAGQFQTFIKCDALRHELKTSDFTGTGRTSR